MIVQSFVFSLVTLSVIANTSMGNQGNHCIVAASQMMPPVNLGNQVLTADAQGCQKEYEAQLLRAFSPLLAGLGLDVLSGGR